MAVVAAVLPFAVLVVLMNQLLGVVVVVPCAYARHFGRSFEQTYFCSFDSAFGLGAKQAALTAPHRCPFELWRFSCGYPQLCLWLYLHAHFPHRWPRRRW